MVSTNLGAAEAALTKTEPVLKTDANESVKTSASNEDLGFSMQPRENELTSLTRGLTSETPASGAMPAATIPAQETAPPVVSSPAPTESKAEASTEPETPKTKEAPEAKADNAANTVAELPAATTDTKQVQESTSEAVKEAMNASAPTTPTTAPGNASANTSASISGNTPATASSQPTSEQATPGSANTFNQQAVMARIGSQSEPQADQATHKSEPQSTLSGSSNGSTKEIGAQSIASIQSKVNAAEVLGTASNNPKGQVDLLYSALQEVRHMISRIHWQFGGQEMPREAWSALGQLRSLQGKINSSMSRASEQAGLNNVSLDHLTPEQLAKMNHQPVFASNLPVVVRARQKAEAERQKRMSEAMQKAVSAQAQEVLKTTGRLQSGMDRLSSGALSKMASDVQSAGQLSRWIAESGGAGGTGIFMLGQNHDTVSGVMSRVSQFQAKEKPSAAQGEPLTR